jgi:CBS domain containing-hemolysin-like protein
MTQNVGPLILISILLVLANAFFVAAEYALVGARRSRVQAIARRKKKSATGLLKVLEDISPYVAGTQIGITMVGIAVGSITEPFVRGLIMHVVGKSVPFTVSYLLSYLLITYFLVVIGELFPKYLAIRMPERVAVFTTWPLVWITRLLLPLVWLAQVSASALLRPFGIDPESHRSEALPKDELLLLIRTGSTEGVIEKMQADLLARALHLDALNAKDIMIHRLDIMSLDVETPKEDLFARLAAIPHSRIPVFEEDIDHVLGVVYLYDIVKHWNDPVFVLRELVRPAAAVPENLTVDKIVTTMRDSKTQIVIVMDEYGGTSGLITLEDVVEEVFGELEDQLERERPPIQILPNGRVTARGDVRYDELVGKLGIDVEEPSTDTLATHIVNALDRIPKLGDHVTCELGTLYVENMARNRITRVSLLPKANLPTIEKDL